MRPPISIVLLNYNTRDLTLAALARFIPESDARGWQLVVVDNASTDGSADAIASAFPSVALVRLNDNRGYAAGNNAGLSVTTGIAVVLLNSDALAEANHLQFLADYLTANPSVGAVLPGLRTANGEAQAFAFGDEPTPGYLLRRMLGRLLPLPPQHNWDATEPVRVDWVSGACLGVRREVIEQIGGLDERYFLYFEDVDWCRRMREAGWRVVYNPTVSIVHLGGQSQPQRRVANRHYAESLSLYYHKWYGRVWGRIIRWLYEIFQRIGA